MLKSSKEEVTYATKQHKYPQMYKLCKDNSLSLGERDTWISLCFTLSCEHLSLVIKLSIYPSPSHSPFQFLPLWKWQVIRMDYRESQEFLRIILHRQKTGTCFLRGTNSAGLLGTAVWLSKFALFKALERHDLSRCVFALSVQSLVSLSPLSSDCYKNVSVITQALIGMQQLSKTVFAE